MASCRDVRKATPSRRYLVTRHVRRPRPRPRWMGYQSFSRPRHPALARRPRMTPAHFNGTEARRGTATPSSDERGVLQLQSSSGVRRPTNLGHFGLNPGATPTSTRPIRRLCDLLSTSTRPLIRALESWDDGLRDEESAETRAYAPADSERAALHGPDGRTVTASIRDLAADRWLHLQPAASRASRRRVYTSPDDTERTASRDHRHCRGVQIIPTSGPPSVERHASLPPGRHRHPVRLERRPAVLARCAIE